MKKQTAVEWLQELYDSRPAYEEFILDDEFEQAKQMEKEQIKNAYHQGVVNEISIYYTPDADQYYNETYAK